MSKNVEYYDTAKAIEIAIESYADALEPCDMCFHTRRRGKLRDYEICIKCCYNYSSQFEFYRQDSSGKEYKDQ